MNNNLYHWHAEQTVKLEMEEVRRAVEQERLLREAGLSRPGLLARVAKTIGSLLKARRERFQSQPLAEPYRSTSQKGRDHLRDSCQSTE